MKFAALLATASAHNLLSANDYKFMEYVSQHGKTYGTVEEYKFRQETFMKKDLFNEEFNANPVNTHTVGHNVFSDRTFDEMKMMNGYKGKKTAKTPVMLVESNATSVDWRTKGAVTPVKNQGQCGSCWAFSTTGSTEAAEFFKTGTLKSFSEQQLVDCAGGSYGNMGCQGGLMDNAFRYIETHSLELESEYPYTAQNGTCHYVASKGVGKVASYNDVTPNNAAQLKAALDSRPVSIAIEADQMAFQGYTGGVITSGCGTQLDHGVLAVGYGTENGTPYFLVKNSWGASWGVNGYVKIGQNNECGILQQPSYPTE